MKIERYIKGRGYYAMGYYNDGEVTVTKGSTIICKWKLLM